MQKPSGKTPFYAYTKTKETTDPYAKIPEAIHRQARIYGGDCAQFPIFGQKSH